MAGERKSKGRRKIEMAKMTKKSNLLVTFSKRRTGLFKKASEICTLCGAEVVVVVFSPAKKVFCFGHPNVEAVIERFVTGAPMPTNPGQASNLLEAHRNASVRELNLQLTHLLEQLEAERKRNDMLNQMKMNNSPMKYWWERPHDELDIDELEKLKEALKDVKDNTKIQLDKCLIEGSSSNPFSGAQYPNVGYGLESYGQENGNIGTYDPAQHFGYGGHGFL